ncbi:lysine-sensitive aspartokinase 3 [Candidatus Woesearchaeota archaeon]|nr:lysine-sensitive aspartokinase 3 [Candidatus Woesearchaeota archaeon]
MKFGGSSVGSPERIREVARIIGSRLERKPIVVVSAVGGVTDMLISAAQKAASEGKADTAELRKKHEDIITELGLDRAIISELDSLDELLSGIAQLGELSPRIMDKVQSFGERCSSKILAACLEKQGIGSRAFDAYDAGMITDDNFGNAEPLPEVFEKLGALSESPVVPVVTGFIGKDREGRITTLGRGGSDYTAAIIGAAVDAEEIQIWTDVNGIMTADPKVVPEAKSIPRVTFDEASELAYFGAKVLHPKTIRPAVRKGIPVRVLSTFEPEKKGTVISIESEKDSNPLKAIASKKRITLINVVSTRMLLAHGFLARIFQVFEEHHKPVDMVSTSEVSVSLTVDNDEHVDEIAEKLKHFAKVKVMREKAIICAVGQGLSEAVGLCGRVFTAVGSEGVNVHMISLGASEINLSFIVDDKDADKAVKSLHKELLE